MCYRDVVHTMLAWLLHTQVRCSAVTDVLLPGTSSCFRMSIRWQTRFTVYAAQPYVVESQARYPSSGA